MDCDGADSSVGSPDVLLSARTSDDGSGALTDAVYGQFASRQAAAAYILKLCMPTSWGRWLSFFRIVSG